MEEINELIEIDGKKALSEEKLEKFARLVNSNEELIISIVSNENGERTLTCTLTSLVDELTDVQVNDSDVIDIFAEKVVLHILGQDKNWYWANTRRLNKLKRALAIQSSDTMSTTEKTIWSVGIATISDEGLKDIRHYQDEKSEIINIMNKEIVGRYSLDNSSVVLFDFDYVEGDENIIEKWQSIDELVQKGRVTLA